MWFKNHKKICKSHKVQQAVKTILPECYVLIEPLTTPQEKYFKDLNSMEKAMQTLDLNDDESEVEEVSDNESSEEEEEFHNKKKVLQDDLKSRAVKSISLTPILKTKLI